MPLGQITNILVGRAPLWLSPEGTTDPADTLAVGSDGFSDWLSPWVHIGFTEDGLDFEASRKEKMHYVDEISNPVVITIDTSDIKVSFTFSEPTIENMKYAFGGGTITTQAAGTGVIGKKTLALSDTVDVLKLGFEGKSPQGFFRRVIIPRVVSVGKIKTEYNRSKKKQVLLANFQAICASSDIKVIDKTANALP